jgi:rubrerythrin
MKPIKAIRDAIEMERLSYELYSELKGLVVDRESRFLCEHLALVELRHKKMLEEISLLDFGNMQGRIDSLGGYKLEVIDFLKKPLKNYELKEILEFAEKKEAEAVNHYRMLAKISPEGELKTFFENMIKEEEKHVQMIAEELLKYKRARKQSF